jgi:hypothetical protein
MDVMFWCQHMFDRLFRSKMLLSHSGKTVSGLRANKQVIIENLTFKECTFDGCGVVSIDSPRKRSVLRNIELESCAESRCSIVGAILDGVTVKNLKVTDALMPRGCLFRHVVLSGRIGRVIISTDVSAPTRPDSALELRFAEHSTDFYQSVDWALDISTAVFSDVTIWGIPSVLVRRDLRSQIVVTREKAMEGKWRNLDLSSTYWPTAFEMFLKRGDSDMVLVAPKAAKNYDALQRGLDLIREAGVSLESPGTGGAGTA